MNRLTKTLVVFAAVPALLTGCAKIGPGQQAVGVSSWGAPTVDDCAKEETQVSDIGTDWKRFPARQSTWDANNEPNAERGPYLALSKPVTALPPAPPPGAPPAPPRDTSNDSTGQAEMAIPVTITFDLTTDCEKLKTFYKNYTTQDNGWLDDDGNPTDGWRKLLTRMISQPADQTILSVTQRYPWQRVWNDESVRTEYVKALTDQLPKEAAKRTDGQTYFENFSINVGKPYPTSEELRKNVDAIQTNQAAADAERIRLTSQADAEKAAAIAQQGAAEAQKAAEIAKAQVRAAEIAGFGTGPEAVTFYLRDLCRKEPTCHQYDPSPIIAGAR